MKFNSIPFNESLFSQRVSTGCILGSPGGTFERYRYPKSTLGQWNQNFCALDLGSMLSKSFQSDLNVPPGLRTTDSAISMSQVPEEVCVSCQKRTRRSHLLYLISYPIIFILACSTPALWPWTHKKHSCLRAFALTVPLVYTTLSPTWMTPTSGLLSNVIFPSPPN